VLTTFYRRIARFALLTALVALLAGCKADEVELQITTTDLRSAAAGNEVLVPFRAVFTHPEPLNTRQSAQVDDIWSVLQEYVEISDFSRDTVDGGLRVVIEGEVPVRTTRNARDAYYLSLTESRNFEGLHRVALETGEQFETLRQQLSAVNFAVDLVAIHPTVTEVSGRASRLMAPAATIEGDSHLIYRARLDGSLRLRQSAGAFEQTGPGFFIAL